MSSVCMSANSYRVIDGSVVDVVVAINILLKGCFRRCNMRVGAHRESERCLRTPDWGLVSSKFQGPWCPTRD
jgi:hypothetical protein